MGVETKKNITFVPVQYNKYYGDEDEEIVDDGRNPVLRRWLLGFM